MASSVAVYGGDMPALLDDRPTRQPQSSYGTQKAMCELLINDYSRRGLVDGRVLRLPTIVIRPGRPNAAASSFASSRLREPLQGTVDGQENPITVIVATNFWEVQDHLSLTGHVYSPAAILGSPILLGGLSDGQRGWFDPAPFQKAVEPAYEIYTDEYGSEMRDRLRASDC